MEDCSFSSLMKTWIQESISYQDFDARQTDLSATYQGGMDSVFQWCVGRMWTATIRITVEDLQQQCVGRGWTLSLNFEKRPDSSRTIWASYCGQFGQSGITPASTRQVSSMESAGTNTYNGQYVTTQHQRDAFGSYRRSVRPLGCPLPHHCSTLQSVGYYNNDMLPWVASNTMRQSRTKAIPPKVPPLRSLRCEEQIHNFLAPFHIDLGQFKNYP